MDINNQAFEKTMFFSSIAACIYITAVMFIFYKRKINRRSLQAFLIIWIPTISIMFLPFYITSDLSPKEKIVGVSIMIFVGVIYSLSIKSIGSSVGKLIKDNYKSIK